MTADAQAAAPIGVYFGSSNGNTEHVAGLVAQALSALSGRPVAAVDIRKVGMSALGGHRLLVLGCSTWDDGELQYDWVDRHPDFQALDLQGVQVALFGCGDQYGYPDTFQDALGILAETARAQGAQVVGRVPTQGYDFSASRAVEDGHFLGLPLDEDNQPDLTADRVQRWTAQLLQEAPGLLAVAQ